MTNSSYRSSMVIYIFLHCFCCPAIEANFVLLATISILTWPLFSIKAKFAFLSCLTSILTFSLFSWIYLLFCNWNNTFFSCMSYMCFKIDFDSTCEHVIVRVWEEIINPKFHKKTISPHQPPQKKTKNIYHSKYLDKNG
mgnify:CR=1 FL=1